MTKKTKIQKQRSVTFSAGEGEIFTSPIKKNVVNELKTNVGALENRLKRIETERNDLLMSTRKLQKENKSLKSAKASLQAKNEHFDNEVRELSQDSFTPRLSIGGFILGLTNDKRG